MSQGFIDPRSQSDLLHEAVLLALSLNHDIKTQEPVFRWKTSDYYLFCEVKILSIYLG